MDDAVSQDNGRSSRSGHEHHGGGAAELASLPDAVRAIVEECKAQTSNSISTAAAEEDEMPYPCRMYEETTPGEEDMLQLQWMRVDMSNMDSEHCWGQASWKGEHNCGPDSGLVLPAVYSLDPTQILPMTAIGLPPELQRAVQGSSDEHDERTPEDVPEDGLFKIGKAITEALTSVPGKVRRPEGLPPDVVAEVVSLSGTDWSVCLERYVDLRRCDPVMFAHLLSIAAAPTLDCLLGSVLPAVVTRMSKPAATPGSASGPGQNGTDNNGDGSRDNGQNSGEQGVETAVTAGHDVRDIAAVHAICRLTASVAASAKGMEQDVDPVWFRDKVSGSELRKLGPLGKEAEIALAEFFFYREAAGMTA
ncbi:unnamed protein product [Scytosiphon promiscuus]